jgi:hypothetical protein
MKTTLIFKTFLAVAICGGILCGFICAEYYSVDESLDQEAIPAFNPMNEFIAPANILPSEYAKEDTSLVQPGDIVVRPPKLTWNDAGQPIIQVQATTRKQAEQPKTPPSELPQTLQSFNAMSEAEKMASLRRSIQSVLVANTKRGVNTRDNTPNDILMMALPYGADAKVWLPNPNFDPRSKNPNNHSGSFIYSMGALCWNMPCNGKTLLRTDGTKIIVKMGHGYQQRPASFAALMAMSRVTDYEIKMGGNSYSMAHIIASERLSISKGMNLSMALVAFSFYGESKDQWANELGEAWNIEKMVTGELNRNIDQGTSDVTDWLLGLTAAVKLYESESKPIRGPLAIAKKQLTTYHEFVLSIQNDRYLWHPKFFLYKGFHPDAFETMYSSGHILRWLVYSLPDKDLKDPRVLRAVNSLAMTVNRVKTETMAKDLNAKQIEGLAVSLHALSLYYQRAFGADPMVAMGN